MAAATFATRQHSRQGAMGAAITSAMSAWPRTAEYGRVRPPPRCFAFDLPNPQPASPAWAVLGALLLLLALKDHHGLGVVALPLVTATALDRGDSRKLILPVALALIAVILAFVVGALKVNLIEIAHIFRFSLDSDLPIPIVGFHLCIRSSLDRRCYCLMGLRQP